MAGGWGQHSFEMSTPIRSAFFAAGAALASFFLSFANAAATRTTTASAAIIALAVRFTEFDWADIFCSISLLRRLHLRLQRDTVGVAVAAKVHVVCLVPHEHAGFGARVRLVASQATDLHVDLASVAGIHAVRYRVM